MQVRVNGDLMEVDSELSVEALLRRLGVNSRMVAVAVNFHCVLKRDFNVRTVQAGDEIEILAPQAGG